MDNLVTLKMVPLAGCKSEAYKYVRLIPELITKGTVITVDNQAYEITQIFIETNFIHGSRNHYNACEVQCYVREWN